MISLKTPEQLRLMREAGKITAEVLLYAESILRDGMSTAELDHKIRAFIEHHGGKPTFLGYGGFPGSACISLNDEVIHGIPSSKRIIRDGDLVKVDVGVTYRGYIGDSARTFGVGEISEQAKQLIEATRTSFFKGMEAAVSGNRIGDVGHAVDAHVTAAGFSTVRQYVGHGVGRELHEEPEVPNYGKQGRGQRLMAGMVIAIEPMIAAGSAAIKVLSDDWTVVTRDSSLAAHYEHSIAVTSDGCVVLSAE